jgi:predicted nucleic acid-binding Zn finger protein
MKKEKAVDYRDVLEALEKVRGLDFIQLSSVFSDRGEKAWELLKESRVKLYVFWPSGRVVWIVVGRDYEYIIYPVVGYCSCSDFYFAVMKGKALVCHHLIAQRLAEILSWYDLIVEEDMLYHSLMEEWKKIETEEVKQSVAQ